MEIPASIFKAYDIRGIVGETLTPAIVQAIGYAFGAQALEQQQPTVCVGYDGRLSSPTLAEALILGLRQAGVNVINLGLVTTPMLYFATHTLSQSQSGVMVTGSHNPPAYNGLKMVLNGQALAGEAIQALRIRMQQNTNTTQALAACQHHTIASSYQAAIVQDIQLARPMRVVIDCGNGVAGAYAPDLFRALGCEVEPLFCEVDGHFPNHHPDPVEEKNLQALIAALQAGDAEIGIAFDGDGDRMGVVIKDGEIIRADRQLMLFADAVLKAQPQASVVFDVKSTRHLRDWISARGGQPILWKTGHSLMKAKMRETKAALGGELSGHLFFNDDKQGQPRWFGFDDGLYSAARLLEIVSQFADASAPLKALPNSLNTPELHIPMAEGEPYALMRILQQQAHFAEAIDVIHLDGLRVEYADGFGLIRASNTTPVLVLRFEADTVAALHRIQQTFKQTLQAVMPQLAFPD